MLGRPDLNLPDGLHPNAAGMRVIATEMWPYLEPLLQSGVLTGPDPGLPIAGPDPGLRQEKRPLTGSGLVCMGSTQRRGISGGPKAAAATRAERRIPSTASQDRCSRRPSLQCIL